MKSPAQRHLKDRLYDEFSRVGKALASPRRLELLDLLAQGERPVEALAGEAAMTVANASQHLQVLRRAHIVETRREGTHVYYRLSSDGVFRLWQALREVGEERLAKVDQVAREYLGDRGGLEPVRMEELREWLGVGAVVVLDVRPVEEFASGHIAGAHSVPLDELEARLAEVPEGAEVVAYCRGPYCVFADEAVERLRKEGRQARRLDLGFPDWKAAGFPVEAGGA